MGNFKVYTSFIGLNCSFCLRMP